MISLKRPGRILLATSLGFVCVVLGLPSFGFSQTTKSAGAPPAKPKIAPDKKKEISDPTKPNPKILEKLRTKATKGKRAITLPKIALKARIISANFPAVALVEVDGEIKMLQKGDEIAAGGNLTVRVVELNEIEIRIEIPSLNRTISLY